MSISVAVKNLIDGAATGASVMLTLPSPSQLPPLISLTVTDDEELRTTRTSLPQRYLELDVECWDITQQKANALAESVKTLFRDFEGPMDGYRILFSRFYNTFDSSDGDGASFGRSFTLKLTYVEE